MKPVNTIRALTLDAAGTLFHVAQPVGESYARLAREFDILVSADQMSRQFRILFPRAPPLAFGKCNPRELQRQERGWWQTLVRNCLGAHARHRNFSAYFDRLYGYYASAQAWRLYPEVPLELQRLAAAGLPVSVVSNFDSRLDGILEALGIHGYFKHIHYSSRCGSAKPQTAIFTIACEELRATPGATLHVGDSYKMDFLGAGQAGLQALWLDRSAPAGESHRIHSLAGLAERLDGGY